MTKPLGRGLFQSLRAQVNADVRDLVRGNKFLRRERYGWARRLLRKCIVGHPIVGLTSAYISAFILLALSEWQGPRLVPWLFGYVESADLAKEAAGIFLTAQIGILAVLTVAISVVTLLTQKDDGSAVNTDVRLYYEESYSYELAASSILLSVVLVLQLFWPFQRALVWMAGESAINHFKLCVTTVHALWLVLNLYLFLHFINTTLMFVEPPSRAILRKRYSANVIIPRDVGRRLMGIYYLVAPERILAGYDPLKGPRISFGAGPLYRERAVVEIARSFRTPSKLYDVWLRPLSYVLDSWQRRTKAAHDQRNAAEHRQREGDLAFMADLNDECDEKFELLLRDGGVPMTRFEKFLIGLSFRFTRTDPSDDRLPSLTDFIEQLVSKVVNQIEAGMPNGFEDALKEAADFHSFALNAQITRDDDGVLVNLAQVAEGLRLQPDYSWIREYRRAYVAATNKITTDGSFAAGMSRLVVRLWPRDATEFPPEVLTHILDLGRIQVVTFEAWITKRAVLATPEGGVAPDLAGSDLRAYEDALVHFVSSWEALELTITFSFAVRQSTGGGDDAYWSSAGASWPALHTHMRNTAYFLAAAVWNEDLTGSERFRDLLVRWLQAFYAQSQNQYAFRDAMMLTPDRLKVPWEEAEAAAARTLIYPMRPLTAKTVFGVLLREAYYDMIAITGAVLLHWFATKLQPSPGTAQTAILTLRGETLADSGNTFDQANPPKTIFRLVFDLLIREALHSPFEEGRYSAYLDGVIRTLSEMATPRMIPGRIYGGFSLSGLQTLTPEFLAIMAGNLPATGDEGIAELFQRLLADHPVFQIDSAVRHYEFQFKQYASDLAGDPDQRFEATVRCFVGDPNLPALRARLKAIFDSIISIIQERRLRRIREAPLDQDRLQTVRDAVQAALLGNPKPLGAFPVATVERTDQPVEARETSWGNLDRGSFTKPEMSGVTFSDLPSLFTDIAANYLQNIGWYELIHRSDTTEEFDSGLGVVAFLDRVRELAEDEALGQELILFLPNMPLGDAVYMTTSGFPAQGLENYGLMREEDADSGVGWTYAGTLGNIRIYIWHGTDTAVLCSRTLLQAVRFGRVRGLDQVFDFELFDAGDPTLSRVRIWMAPKFQWEDRPIIQFTFPDLAPQPDEDGEKDDPAAV